MLLNKGQGVTSLALFCINIQGKSFGLKCVVTDFVEERESEQQNRYRMSRTYAIMGEEI